MRKIGIILAFVPAFIFAAPSSSGMSLYGSQSQQGQVADCSHLTRDEQAFASKLSSIHKTVFCQQFSPQQRQDTMALVKMKDPLNTSPGQITPDHAVEIILQSSRNTGTNQMQPQQQQQMPQQYQPRNQQRGQGYPYSQQQGQSPQQSGRGSGSCKQY